MGTLEGSHVFTERHSQDQMKRWMDKGLFIFVLYQSPMGEPNNGKNGHWALAVDYTDISIKLMDPWVGKFVWKTWKWFESHWWDSKTVGKARGLALGVKVRGA